MRGRAKKKSFGFLKVQGSVLEWKDQYMADNLHRNNIGATVLEGRFSRTLTKRDALGKSTKVQK